MGLVVRVIKGDLHLGGECVWAFLAANGRRLCVNGDQGSGVPVTVVDGLLSMAALSCRWQRERFLPVGIGCLLRSGRSPGQAALLTVARRSREAEGRLFLDAEVRAGRGTRLAARDLGLARVSER